MDYFTNLVSYCVEFIRKNGWDGDLTPIEWLLVQLIPYVPERPEKVHEHLALIGAYWLKRRWMPMVAWDPEVEVRIEEGPLRWPSSVVMLFPEGYEGSMLFTSTGMTLYEDMIRERSGLVNRKTFYGSIPPEILRYLRLHRHSYLAGPYLWCLLKRRLNTTRPLAHIYHPPGSPDPPNFYGIPASFSSWNSRDFYANGKNDRMPQCILAAPEGFLVLLCTREFVKVLSDP